MIPQKFLVYNDGLKLPALRTGWRTMEVRLGRVWVYYRQALSAEMHNPYRWARMKRAAWDRSVAPTLTAREPGLPGV